MMPFSGFGFGSSSQSSQQSASGSSQGSTFVDESQAPFLDFLRNMAQGSFGGFQQGQQQFGGQAQQLGSQSLELPSLLEILVISPPCIHCNHDLITLE